MEGTGIITPDHDPYAAALAAAVTTEVFDLDEQTWHIRRTQDVEPILDANKHDANHAENYTPSRDLKHVARIPFVVAELWRNEHGVDVFNPSHAPAVARLLNSNEWKFLRTGGGRVGAK